MQTFNHEIINSLGSVHLRLDSNPNHYNPLVWNPATTFKQKDDWFDDDFLPELNTPKETKMAFMESMSGKMTANKYTPSSLTPIPDILSKKPLHYGTRDLPPNIPTEKLQLNRMRGNDYDEGLNSALKAMEAMEAMDAMPQIDTTLPIEEENINNWNKVRVAKHRKRAGRYAAKEKLAPKQSSVVMVKPAFDVGGGGVGNADDFEGTNPMKAARNSADVDVIVEKFRKRWDEKKEKALHDKAKTDKFLDLNVPPEKRINRGVEPLNKTLERKAEMKKVMNVLKEKVKNTTGYDTDENNEANPTAPIQRTVWNLADVPADCLEFDENGDITAASRKKLNTLLLSNGLGNKKILGQMKKKEAVEAQIRKRLDEAVAKTHRGLKAVLSARQSRTITVKRK